MELSGYHRTSLNNAGIGYEKIDTQAPLLAETMRKIVDAILSGEQYIRLRHYNGTKNKISKKKKKFKLPSIDGLPHNKRKELSGETFHKALQFVQVDLQKNEVELACKQIGAEYAHPVNPNKIEKDAIMLVGALFLFRKTNGKKAFLSTLKTLTKNPYTGALSESDIASILKIVLQKAQENTNIDYNQLVKKLKKYQHDLLIKYPESILKEK